MRLYELFPSANGGTLRALVASFTTTQTQLRLPPGFLVTGKTYMMQLRAFYVPGANPDVPFLDGPSVHYATALTSKFQP
ncbi:MAG: hypothetical protein ACXU86_25285 [Archangium sp.]